MALPDVVLVFPLHEVPRIDRHLEVRAARLLVDLVYLLVDRALRVRRSAHREVRAGGKAHYADLGGIDVELRRIRPYPAYRALRVRKRAVALVGNAVLENDARYALVLEPLRDFDAFVVPGEDSIAAAWADDDRGGRLLGADDRRHDDLRHADVCDAHHVVRHRLDALWLRVLLRQGNLALGPDFVRRVGRIGKSSRRHKGKRRYNASFHVDIIPNRSPACVIKYRPYADAPVETRSRTVLTRSSGRPASDATAAR